MRFKTGFREFRGDLGQILGYFRDIHRDFSGGFMGSFVKCVGRGFSRIQRVSYGFQRRIKEILGARGVLRGRRVFPVL